MLYQPVKMSWRQGHNPLRGLTMARAVAIIASGEWGMYPEMQWLYRYVERREATLKACKQRRVSAIRKLPWTVKVVDELSEEDKAKAEVQQKALKAHYNRIENLTEAIAWLVSAEFRGFAHLEKHYFLGNPKRGIRRLQPVPQWFWTQQYPSNAWLYNSEATNSNYGKKIDPAHFVVREVESPVDEIATIYFIRKSMALKDWDGYLETFGIPPIFVELPMGQGGPTSADGTSDTWQEIADSVIGNARGVLPNGAKLATVNPGSSAAPFRDHVDYQDKQIVLAATSGLLTVLNEATGLGSGQSESHDAAFRDLASGDAMAISELFQQGIDKPYLREAFPGERILCYFDIETSTLGDGRDIVTDAVQLAQLGMKIKREVIEEVTGYSLEDEQPQPGAPGAQGAAPGAAVPAAGQEADGEGDGGAEDGRALGGAPTEDGDGFEMPASGYGHSLLNSFARFDWTDESKVEALLNTTGERLLKTKLANSANGRIQKKLALAA